jgi:lipopolysaccharide transport system ATP-binding protein
MSDTLIKVEGVSKKFCRSLKRSLWYGMKDLGNEVLGRRHGGNGELRSDEFWAVNDVSFELKRGECLGLIGPNGAGKSTLLKMLNGLIKPDKGRITMRGRVGALIELGAGFNPILTGRENIYVNGAVLGLTKEEIDRKFEEIVEFAEIRAFLDTPVQNYSSGMKVRLGFAIAAQMEPDVLIIDEVLAVGDIGFRSKCYTQISEIVKKAAVIFVSHQMQQIGKLCNKAIVLQKGKVHFKGDANKSISIYNELFDFKEQEIGGTREASISNVVIKDENGCEQYNLRFDSQINIDFNLEISRKYEAFHASIGFMGQDGSFITECHSGYNGFKFHNSGGLISISLCLQSINLNPGNYYLAVVISDEKNTRPLLWHPSALKFKVEGDFFSGAPTQMKGEWQCSSPV